MQNNHKLRQSLLALILLLSSSYSYALDIPAALHWSKRVELGTPVNGIITQVNVNIGQRVEKNTVLVKLDARGFDAAKTKVQAKVKNLKQVYLEAKRQQDRAQELYDRTVLSDHDLQVAKNALTAAQSDYKTAQADLIQADLDLEYSTLRAPYNAIILKRNAEVGQTVVSELKPETLIVIAAGDQMIAKGQIAQQHLNGELHDQPATVVIDGLSYQGKVKHVGLEPVKQDKQGTWYEIEVEFNIGQRTFRAGQQAKIILP